MHIRRAQPEDAASLTKIAHAAKRHWGYPERCIEQWKQALTIELAFLQDHETFAACNNERIVGFYALCRQTDRMRMEHMWVLPEAMGRGIGRALFLHAVERTRSLGFNALEIESDPNAAGFYERMGARRIGAIVTKVDDQPRELPVLVCEIAEHERT